jgi:hypothetical protein
VNCQNILSDFWYKYKIKKRRVSWLTLCHWDGWKFVTTQFSLNKNLMRNGNSTKFHLAKMAVGSSFLEVYFLFLPLLFDFNVTISISLNMDFYLLDRISSSFHSFYRVINYFISRKDFIFQFFIPNDTNREFLIQYCWRKANCFSFKSVLIPYWSK